jgi:hypothetical protein
MSICAGARVRPFLRASTESGTSVMPSLHYRGIFWDAATGRAIAGSLLRCKPVGFARLDVSALNILGGDSQALNC